MRVRTFQILKLGIRKASLRSTEPVGVRGPSGPQISAGHLLFGESR